MYMAGNNLPIFLDKNRNVGIRIYLSNKIHNKMTAIETCLKHIEDYAEHTSNPFMKLLFTILTPLLYTIGTVLVFAAEHITNTEVLRVIQVSLGVLLGVLSLIWSAWKNRQVTQEIVAHFREAIGVQRKKLQEKSKVWFSNTPGILFYILALILLGLFILSCYTAKEKSLHKTTQCPK